MGQTPCSDFITSEPFHESLRILFSSAFPSLSLPVRSLPSDHGGEGDLRPVPGSHLGHGAPDGPAGPRAGSQVRCHHSKEFSRTEPFVSRICLGRSVVTNSEWDLGSVPSSHRPPAPIAEELHPSFPGRLGAPRHVGSVPPSQKAAQRRGAGSALIWS